MAKFIYIGTPGNDRQYGGNSSNYISGIGWVYDDPFLDGLGGDDELSVYNGNATLIGGLGNDKLYGGADRDRLEGGSGNDLLDGGKGANTLIGGLGNDTLRQSYDPGADTMVGGAGDDLYEVRSSRVQITEIGGQGLDTVKANVSFVLPNFVEVLDLEWSAEAINGTGNAQHNTLIGNSNANSLSGMAGDDSLFGDGGNDTLVGGDGDDTLVVGNYYQESATLLGGNGDDVLRGYAYGSDYMAGGSGDDLYYVEHGTSEPADTVVEAVSAGYDEVVCATDGYQLPENIEVLALVGSASAAYGNSGNNIITGNSQSNQITADEGSDTLHGMEGSDTLNAGPGNDVIDGGTDADHMVGGQGNDTYFVDSSETYRSDKVVELANGGIDRLLSAVDRTLDANVEQLTLLPGARNATGNSLANTLEGNAAGNALFGEGGADSLSGRDGSDRLFGGAGADMLDGGAGNDLLCGAATASFGRNESDSLTGGAGADRFLLGDARGRYYDDGNAANRGTLDYALITDFTVGQDRLQLDGAAANYYLGQSGLTGVSGIGLWAEQGATDELIAIIRSANSTTLNATNTITPAQFV